MIHGRTRALALVLAIVTMSLVGAIPASLALSWGLPPAQSHSVGESTVGAAVSYGGPPVVTGPVACPGSTPYAAAQVVILPNGTAYPYHTAPVTRTGNTYTLTEPLSASLLVLVSNAVVDGSNCAVHYTKIGPNGNNTAVEARAVTNVTLETFNVTGAETGLGVNGSKSVTVYDSDAQAATFYGIWGNNSLNVNLTDDNVSYSDWGIYLSQVLGGWVADNEIFEAIDGVEVSSSTSVTLIANDGRGAGDVGVDLEDNTNITVQDNNFSGNQNLSLGSSAFSSGQDTDDVVVGNNFSGHQTVGAQIDESGGTITFSDNDLTGGIGTGLYLGDDFYGLVNAFANDIQNATRFAVELYGTGGTNLTENNLSTDLASPGSIGIYDYSSYGSFYAVDNVIDGPWNIGVYVYSLSAPTVVQGNTVDGAREYGVEDYYSYAGVTIVGNILVANRTLGTADAIYLDVAFATTLAADNHISGNFSYGVYIYYTFGPTDISHNVLANVTNASIYLYYLYGTTSITGNDLSANTTTDRLEGSGVDLFAVSYSGLTVSGNNLGALYIGISLATVYGSLTIDDNVADHIRYYAIGIDSSVYGNSEVIGNLAVANGSGAYLGIDWGTTYGNLTIAGNRLTGPFQYPIYVEKTYGWTNVSGNVATNYTEIGIYLAGPEAGLLVEGNDLAVNTSGGGATGLYVAGVGGPSAVIEDNNATGGLGIGINLVDAFAISNVVYNNDVSGTTLYGLRLYESDSPTYLLSNDIRDSQNIGVEAYGDAYAYIEDNQLQGSAFALNVSSIEYGSAIEENNASGSKIALVAYISYYYSVTPILANDFSGSASAYVNWTIADFEGNNFLGTPIVGLTHDEFATFYHNNLDTGVGSTLNLTGSVPEPGSFNAPLPIGGNFWTGYTPTTCSDGVCSPPYLVPSLLGSSGYYDEYPLGKAWTSYAITFSERGLPAGTEWTVNIGSTTLTAAAPASIAFYPENLAPVSYHFSIPGVGAFTGVTPSSGSVNASGSPITITVTFSQPSFAVAFSESGLAAGTTWYVNSTGTPAFASQAFTVATSGSETFPLGNLTNGSYAFSVALSRTGYTTADPTSGSITVAGAGVLVTYAYSIVTYAVTFTIAGLPAGSGWSVTVAEGTESSTTATISFSLANGTYGYSVTVPTGYTVSAGSSVTVAGSPVDAYLAASPANSGSSSPSGDHGALLAAIGVIVVLAIVAVLGWLFYFRRGRNQGPGGASPPAPWSEPGGASTSPPPGAIGAPPPGPPPSG